MLPEPAGAPVTVMCSGVALGVYVPALLVARRLEELDVDVEVAAIESLYDDRGLEQLARLRTAYHRNFALALVGHRMTTGAEASLDSPAVDALLDRWAQEERSNFVVWSGFWMPVLDAYRRRVRPARICVDVCRIDAVESATFKAHRPQPGETEVWLWCGADGTIHEEIPVVERAPLPWDDRRPRCVVHGGGWGIGTYQTAIPELARAGIALDVVGYEPADLATRDPINRYFMVDPAWSAWEPGPDGRLEFPPFGEVDGAGHGHFRRRDRYHPFYDLASSSRAIISKPGGGTMIDSLASATPLVILEAYGHAEERNAEVWEGLGFGIGFDRWRALGFDPAVLAELHENLLARRRAAVTYPERYASRLGRSSPAADRS